MSESDATQLAFDMGLYGSTLATHGYRAFNVFSNAASELLFADEDLDPCSPQSQQTDTSASLYDYGPPGVRTSEENSTSPPQHDSSSSTPEPPFWSPPPPTPPDSPGHPGSPPESSTNVTSTIAWMGSYLPSRESLQGVVEDTYVYTSSQLFPSTGWEEDDEHLDPAIGQECPTPGMVPNSTAAPVEEGGVGGDQGMDEDVIPPWEVGASELPVSWEEAASFGCLGKGPMTGGQHCWGEPNAQVFKVRGANYLTDKQKVASGPSLFRLLAVDLNAAPPGTDLAHTASAASSPLALLHRLCRTEGKGACPFVLVINFLFQIGDEAAGNMAFYFVRRQDEGEEDAAARLNSYLLSADLDHTKNGPKRRASCLKVIPIIREGPWLVKNAIPSEKPAIISKQIELKTHRGLRYLEVDIDTTSSRAGNSIIGALQGATKGLVIDLAFVWEGKTAEYLPERVLGTARVSYLDVKRAIAEWEPRA